MLALMTTGNPTGKTAPASQGRRRPHAAEDDSVTLFLCGDVMTGRGIDQVLPHPGDPRLYEAYTDSALDYVALAERANGPIPRPVDFAYIWGDALNELNRVGPDLRIINLETAVTRAVEPLPKGINYKMNPDNVPCLTAAAIDCCILANNHVLDWRQAGLAETLETLAGAGLKYAGAGRDLAQAEAPAILDAPGKGRVLVFALAAPSGGVPQSWAAAENGSGIAFLPALNDGEVQRIARRVAAVRRQGDIIVASIHWGGNWGYEVPASQTEFARGLIREAAVDIVHCHSSHHAKGIEVHDGKLILYGCGDFINDYEGIGGYEAYRDDLRMMYFATVAPRDGQLLRLEMAPLRACKFRLQRAAGEEIRWLRDMFNREGRRFETGVEMTRNGALNLRWG